MIPQTALSVDARWAVIQHLKGFSPRFVEENPAEPIAIPPAPPRLPEVAARGRELYHDAGCVECHGEGGRGDGPAVRPEMAPADLTVRPLRSGPRPDDLYRTIAAGLDGTAMPSYADALDPPELWALVAHVESLADPAMRDAAGIREERIGRAIEMHGMPDAAGAPPIMRRSPGGEAGGRRLTDG